LDLVFFHRFDRQEDNLRTIIPENNKTLQNFLALNLVLGLPIRERFKDEEFQKLLYKHLLLSLYKINDPYLLDKIFNLALPHKVWSDLYEKKHPLLHQVFLRKLLFCFGEWMKQSMFNTQKLVQLIELSAKLTDKAGYS
jgi:hypothetical protein